MTTEKTLLGWDKSAAEARFVAAKAFVETGSRTYLDIINSGVKIHVWFGLRLIQRGICPLSEDEFLAQKTPPAKQWYFIAKRSVHGFSYGMGAVKWAKVVAKDTDGDVIVSTPVAKAIRLALYEEIDSIPQWQQSVISHLRRTPDRLIVTPFGRPRRFMERWGDDLFGEAFAFEPQSTIADDVAHCTIRVAKTIPWYELLQQNYDSLLGQCEDSRVDEAVALMRPLLVYPIEVRSFDRRTSFSLVIPVSFKKGKNWQDLEEFK